NAMIHSVRGLRYTIAHEAAVRQEVIVLTLAVLLGFFVAPSPAWYVAMIGVLLILLAVELLNTSIERLSDHVTPEHHIEIGMIKDAGSAAVFCLSLGPLTGRPMRDLRRGRGHARLRQRNHSHTVRPI